MAVKLKKIIKMTLLALLFLVLIVFCYFFVGRAPEPKTIEWGVNFSQKHSQNLGLDWKDNYLALLDDLGVKNLKVATYWDLIEKKDGEYDFSDLDWQIQEASKRNAKVLLVLGMKTPRWPECHIPDWAKGLSKEEQQEKISTFLKEMILHYRDSTMWQVENEPFFPFGDCPWVDKKFLKKEIQEVKSLDPQKRPVVITESGEFPLWIMAARYGDVVGVTMYKKVWFHQFGFYLTYPFPPVFYYRKAQIVKNIFGKEIIGVELQAEPWGPKLVYDMPLSEQEKTMDLEQFKSNVNFAKETGLSAHYLWGAEWWYWMKEKQKMPAIWEEAKKLFNS